MIDADEVLEKSIVKFEGKWWLVHENKGERLILWRNGLRALVPKDEVETFKRSDLSE